MFIDQDDRLRRRRNRSIAGAAIVASVLVTALAFGLSADDGETQALTTAAAQPQGNPAASTPTWGKVIAIRAAGDSETALPEVNKVASNPANSTAISTVKRTVELPRASELAAAPAPESSLLAAQPMLDRDTSSALDSLSDAPAVPQDLEQLWNGGQADTEVETNTKDQGANAHVGVTPSAASPEVVRDLAAREPSSADVQVAFGPGADGRDLEASLAGGGELPVSAIFADADVRKKKNGPIRVKVKSGDSMYAILKARGLPPGTLPALLDAGKEGDRLNRIRPGQALDFFVSGDGELERLEYRPDDLTTVSFRRSGDGFESEILQTEYERRERTVTGVIESSLFLDGQRAGLSDRTIMQMAEVFGWDVDFALNLRDGDRFTVIHEELYRDNRKVRDGDILAAEFINRGRVFRAVRFLTPKGDVHFYTPDGRSMRKAFLRTPVRFARISSRFNLRRKHPILHKVRAHRGVDYAAPSGTPIRATGDGRIQFRGRKGGYGKTIIITHTGGKYSTLYAHLKGYARGIRNGTSVRQGQVIGYVGKTGLATGPHLHYEFRVRGVHKDPLKVRLPKALPIAKRYKKSFQRQARKLIARLNSDAATVAQRN